jgi:hypothetical protein
LEFPLLFATDSFARREQTTESPRSQLQFGGQFVNLSRERRMTNDEWLIGALKFHSSFAPF